jgi:hypothetical protein
LPTAPFTSCRPARSWTTPTSASQQTSGAPAAPGCVALRHTCLAFTISTPSPPPPLHTTSVGLGLARCSAPPPLTHTHTPRRRTNAQAVHGRGAGPVAGAAQQPDRPCVLQRHPLLHLPAPVCRAAGLLHRRHRRLRVAGQGGRRWWWWWCGGGDFEGALRTVVALCAQFFFFRPRCATPHARRDSAFASHDTHERAHTHTHTHT